MSVLEFLLFKPLKMVPFNIPNVRGVVVLHWNSWDASFHHGAIWMKALFRLPNISKVKGVRREKRRAKMQKHHQ